MTMLISNARTQARPTRFHMASSREGCTGLCHRAVTAVVHPSGVLGRLAGARPFFNHFPLDVIELLHHFRRSRIDGQLQAVTALVAEIDGFEDSVVGGADDLDAI